MWIIKQIFDGEYGCEEVREGEETKVSVTLMNEFGERRNISVSDNWLTANNLNEGDIWPYKFYGYKDAVAQAVTDEYKGIRNPIELYEALMDIWCEDTCAPRLRNIWNENNKTCGQCSITAFLVQDIFGGQVYGILRNGGNYHCYNVIDKHKFDLTSEQFFDEVLNYEDNPEQFREVHFAKEEKRLRYELLKRKLKEYCDNKYCDNK